MWLVHIEMCWNTKFINNFEDLVFKKNAKYLINKIGTSLVAQWLGLLALNAEDLGSIPGRETRSHKPHNSEFLCSSLRLGAAK